MTGAFRFEVLLDVVGCAQASKSRVLATAVTAEGRLNEEDELGSLEASFPSVVASLLDLGLSRRSGRAKESSSISPAPRGVSSILVPKKNKVKT